jgi:predicted amino acid dehydrogenase
MNIIKVMETIIKEWTACDTLAANLAANELLNAFDKLGLELKEKEELSKV